MIAEAGSGKPDPLILYCPRLMCVDIVNLVSLPVTTPTEKVGRKRQDQIIDYAKAPYCCLKTTRAVPEA